MNKAVLIIMSLVIGASNILAGAKQRGNVSKLKTVENKRNFEKVSYALPANRSDKLELTVYQALAAAITQTAVLLETRRERWLNAESPKKTITLRGNRITMSYSRNLYEQQCYLAIGPLQKWRTINGFWAARHVNSRALKRALDVLKKNGITVQSVSISVSDNRSVLEAQRMLHRIGLGKIAIVGHDSGKPTHATVTFNTNI